MTPPARETFHKPGPEPTAENSLRRLKTRLHRWLHPSTLEPDIVTAARAWAQDGDRPQTTRRQVMLLDLGIVSLRQLSAFGDDRFTRIPGHYIVEIEVLPAADARILALINATKEAT